jgi:hypothetical protein
VLEFHDRKKLEKFTESLIGYFGFDISDVTNFSGEATGYDALLFGQCKD